MVVLHLNLRLLLVLEEQCASLLEVNLKWICTNLVVLAHPMAGMMVTNQPWAGIKARKTRAGAATSVEG